ncbi:MAG: hypothetical protein ACOYNY_23615, partial [Caldilineaceae bacterium]
MVSATHASARGTTSQLGNGSNNREQTLQIDGAASNTTADLAVTTGSVRGTDQDRLQYPAAQWSVPCTRVDRANKPRA